MSMISGGRLIHFVGDSFVRSVSANKRTQIPNGNNATAYNTVNTMRAWKFPMRRARQTQARHSVLTRPQAISVIRFSHQQRVNSL